MSIADHTVAEAATLVSVTRRTIYRKVKDAVLSAKTNDAGTTVIETSELLRVFGASTHSEEAPVSSGSLPEQPDYVTRLLDEMFLLRGQVTDLQSQVEKLQGQTEELLKLEDKTQAKSRWQRMFNK